MLPTMAKFDIQSFVLNYAGPKLRLLMTGVGSYATGILGIPGASSVVDSIYVPYSKESVALLLKRFHPTADDTIRLTRSVSYEMVMALHLCNCWDSNNILPITVTGAITTTRFRRGPNHAYIAFGPTASTEVYHLQLDKLDESEHSDPSEVARRRYVQDRMVSESAIALATSTPSGLVDELMANGFMTRAPLPSIIAANGCAPTPASPICESSGLYYPGDDIRFVDTKSEDE